MPSKPMLITLDSPSVQLRPNPALPVTAPFGVVPNSPDPKTSRMPSPVPGPMATLFWIALFPIWADDLNERTTPKATLLLITASRMVTDDPLNATTPACETGLPFPVMVLTVVIPPKLASPKFAELLTRLTPVPALPEIVLPPMKSAVALARLTPIRRFPGASLVPLPVIWFIAMIAVEPNTMWMPFDALALIVLPAPTLKLSTPMRAEPPLNTPTPIRPFWLTCELITVAAALSIATPSRALLSTVQLSTTPLAPWA